jgi:hypothetical protein
MIAFPATVRLNPVIQDAAAKGEAAKVKVKMG